MTRRNFVATSAASVAASPAVVKGNGTRPALLGGQPVRSEPFTSWPVCDQTEEQGLVTVLNSRKWGRTRGNVVDRFEAEYSKLTGAKHCLAVANGTSALLTALNSLEIQAGDEVILPPYTFVATVNAILQRHALPVFADIDPATFQLDPKKAEALITDRTAAIIPVHIGGSAADLDSFSALGKKRNIPILEDACQAHLAEWRGRHVGTQGAMGCFSFQASKNLNSGEGGAVLTNDDELAARAFAVHNNSTGRATGGHDFSRRVTGSNFRLTEFQASLLLSQMTRIERFAKKRDENARYLTERFLEIPGITPAKMYEGCTRNAYHLYMFRYDKTQFAGLPRAKFLKAMSAERIPCSGGYTPLNAEPLIENTLKSRGYQRIYSAERLKRWREQNVCPLDDQLCQEGVWFTQNMLVGSRTDMEQIVEAVRKIQRHAGELAQS
ncbi:MAG: DegT/DnrJ/EryC1/StrS family aminotransferase [Bryobacteraceae bacterium]